MFLTSSNPAARNILLVRLRDRTVGQAWQCTRPATGPHRSSVGYCHRQCIQLRKKGVLLKSAQYYETLFIAICSRATGTQKNGLPKTHLHSRQPGVRLNAVSCQFQLQHLVEMIIQQMQLQFDKKVTVQANLIIFYYVHRSRDSASGQRCQVVGPAIWSDIPRASTASAMPVWTWLPFFGNATCIPCRCYHIERGPGAKHCIAS